MTSRESVGTADNFLAVVLFGEIGLDVVIMTLVLNAVSFCCILLKQTC